MLALPVGRYQQSAMANTRRRKPDHNTAFIPQNLFPVWYRSHCYFPESKYTWKDRQYAFGVLQIYIPIESNIIGDIAGCTSDIFVYPA